MASHYFIQITFYKLDQLKTLSHHSAKDSPWREINWVSERSCSIYHWCRSGVLLLTLNIFHLLLCCFSMYFKQVNVIWDGS